MSSEAHSYKREEVAKHCSTEDCWIILHNKVYDVTKFLSRHPGGEAVILKVAGRDATEQFESVRHSAEARDLAAKLTIGNLDPSEHREYKSGCSLM